MPAQPFPVYLSFSLNSEKEREQRKLNEWRERLACVYFCYWNCKQSLWLLLLLQSVKERERERCDSGTTKRALARVVVVGEHKHTKEEQLYVCVCVRGRIFYLELEACQRITETERDRKRESLCHLCMRGVRALLWALSSYTAAARGCMRLCSCLPASPPPPDALHHYAPASYRVACVCATVWPARSLSQWRLMLP